MRTWYDRVSASAEPFFVFRVVINSVNVCLIDEEHSDAFVIILEILISPKL